MSHPTPDPLRETDVPHMHPMEVMARNFRAKQRAALAAQQPAPDPLREAAQAVLDCWDSRNWKAAPTADYMRRLRAALAAAPQPETRAWAVVRGGRIVPHLTDFDKERTQRWANIEKGTLVRVAIREVEGGDDAA